MSRLIATNGTLRNSPLQNPPSPTRSHAQDRTDIHGQLIQAPRMDPQTVFALSMLDPGEALVCLSRSAGCLAVAIPSGSRSATPLPDGHHPPEHWQFNSSNRNPSSPTGCIGFAQVQECHLESKLPRTSQVAARRAILRTCVRSELRLFRTDGFRQLRHRCRVRNRLPTQTPLKLATQSMTAKAS